MQGRVCSRSRPNAVISSPRIRASYPAIGGHFLGPKAVVVCPQTGFGGELHGVSARKLGDVLPGRTDVQAFRSAQPRRTGPAGAAACGAFSSPWRQSTPEHRSTGLGFRHGLLIAAVGTRPSPSYQVADWMVVSAVSAALQQWAGNSPTVAVAFVVTFDRANNGPATPPSAATFSA